MSLGPAVLGGWGLDILRFSPGVALLKFAKVFSKLNLSAEDWKVRRASGSNFLLLPFGLKISILVGWVELIFSCRYFVTSAVQLIYRDTK